MNTNLFTGLLLLLGTLFYVQAYAQPTYEAGILPAFNLNTSLSNKWKLNFKSENRFLFVKDAFSEQPDRGLDFVLSDLSVIVSRKVGLNNSLGAGYLLRFRDNNFQHRHLWQFTIVPVGNPFRLAHRFAADQTLDEEAAAQSRLRYRLAIELPLNGTAVDPGEFYFKANQEQLHIFSDGQYDLEFRLVPVLGVNFSDDNKLEAGLDYRIDGFIESAATNTLFTTLSWFRAF
ncbi:DUF2490 domain-containing protein [Roseivirga sp. BDSF3-8]|uniref:DUF2490 domain-containing protein n=1 Tax=Roseivirga sp. BDSF3-8 TaxID=3241598 RepID=UPI0035321225